MMSTPGPRWDKLPNMGIKRLFRYYWLRLYRLQGNPTAVAGGFAIGIFVGLTPTLPVQTPIILALTLLTRTSFPAGILSSWLICNPLTMVPIYYWSYNTGQALFGSAQNGNDIQSLIASINTAATLPEIINSISTLGGHAVFLLLVGSLVFAAPLGLISYFPAKRLAETIKNSQNQRRAKRQSDRKDLQPQAR